MKFPALGDHVPQSVGTDVWDPYVLNMVYNELDRRLPLHRGADLQRRLRHQDEHRRRQDERAVPGGQPERGADRPTAACRSSTTCTSARCWRTRRPARSRPCTRAPVIRDRGTTAPATGHHRQGMRKICTASATWPCYNREQVGSSFKPYILAAAVKQGMNVQTSTLDGYDYLYIPPDAERPERVPVHLLAGRAAGWYRVTNDSPGENGPFTPQMAMAESINTAFSDLWHVVAGGTARPWPTWRRRSAWTPRPRDHRRRLAPRRCRTRPASRSARPR